LKKALKYNAYSVIAGPIVIHRKFPGNMGNGAIREAAVNIKKKISRIGAALIINTLKESRRFLLAD